MRERRGFGLNRPFYTDWVLISGGALATIGAVSSTIATPSFLWLADLGFYLAIGFALYVGIPLLIRGVLRRVLHLSDGPIREEAPPVHAASRLRVKVGGGTVTFVRSSSGKVTARTTGIAKDDQARALAAAKTRAAAWLQEPFRPKGSERHPRGRGESL